MSSRHHRMRSPRSPRTRGARSATNRMPHSRRAHGRTVPDDSGERRSVSGRDVPRRLPLSHRRSFVQRHTRPRDVAGVEPLHLHLADDVEGVWHATEDALGIDGAPIPFWAFAWAGGLALARYVLDHPDEVRDKAVLDFATGSGLVGIAAARGGARHVVAADIDPFAEAAVALNARANHVHLAWHGRDLLEGEPPAVDVLLAAD